jgi:DNA-binding transcriptional LysR family regulator
VDEGRGEQEEDAQPPGGVVGACALEKPAAEPELLEGACPLRTAQDLRHHALLHDDTATTDGAYPNWPMWLRAAGLEDVDPARGLRFDYPGLVLDAAAAGRGVALALSAVAAADLAAGRLVMPFAVAAPTPFAYYVVCAEATAERPKVAAFRRCCAPRPSGTRPPHRGGARLLRVKLDLDGQGNACSLYHRVVHNHTGAAA